MAYVPLEEVYANGTYGKYVKVRTPKRGTCTCYSLHARSVKNYENKENNYLLQINIAFILH